MVFMAKWEWLFTLQTHACDIIRTYEFRPSEAQAGQKKDCPKNAESGKRIKAAVKNLRHCLPFNRDSAQSRIELVDAQAHPNRSLASKTARH